MQADLAFPQSLAEKYRPRTITEFIGLEKPKKILGKFAAKPYPSAWLFVGPPGVGKTSMALALASQIGAELHHLPSGKCNAQSIEETVRLCHYMPMTPGGLHLVLVDEADGAVPGWGVLCELRAGGRGAAGGAGDWGLFRGGGVREAE